MRLRSTTGYILSSLAAILVMMASATQAQTPKSLTVRLGWQPLAGGSAAIAMVMQRDKLFERAAEPLGYNLTIDWKTFAAGPPSNEAMVAGHLDLEIVGPGQERQELEEALLVRDGGDPGARARVDQHDRGAGNGQPLGVHDRAGDRSGDVLGRSPTRAERDE